MERVEAANRVVMAWLRRRLGLERGRASEVITALRDKADELAERNEQVGVGRVRGRKSDWLAWGGG